MIHPVLRREHLFMSPTCLSDIPTSVGPAGISLARSLSSRNYGQLINSDINELGQYFSFIRKNTLNREEG